MNIQEIQSYATAMLNFHVNNNSKFIVTPWVFKWNNRVKSFGIVKFHQRTFELSKKALPGESDEVIIETVLHEIAHILAGYKAGHGNKWKQEAKRIGLANPTQTTNRDPNNKGAMPKWVIVFGTEIVREYHRSPGYKVQNHIKEFFVPSRKEETKGHLEMIAYNEYLSRI